MQVKVLCFVNLTASAEAFEIPGGFPVISHNLHCWVSAAPVSSCSRFLGVLLQVVGTCCEAA